MSAETLGRSVTRVVLDPLLRHLYPLPPQFDAASGVKHSSGDGSRGRTQNGKG